MDKQNFVEPGQILAGSEEALAGEGTYDDGNEIRAATFARGHQINDYVAEANGVKTIASIEKGDVVLGLVSYIRSDMASVTILEVKGKEGRTMFQKTEGTLRVAKVDNKFVEDMGHEFRAGDFIRAKVIGTRGGPQLATDQPHLGVIKAFSKDSGMRALVLEDGRLRDIETGHYESRKYASDYGSGKL